MVCNPLENDVNRVLLTRLLDTSEISKNVFVSLVLVFSVRPLETLRIQEFTLIYESLNRCFKLNSTHALTPPLVAELGRRIAAFQTLLS